MYRRSLFYAIPSSSPAPRDAVQTGKTSLFIAMYKNSKLAEILIKKGAKLEARFEVS